MTKHALSKITAANYDGKLNAIYEKKLKPHVEYVHPTYGELYYLNDRIQNLFDRVKHKNPGLITSKMETQLSKLGYLIDAVQGLLPALPKEESKAALDILRKESPVAIVNQLYVAIERMRPELLSQNFPQKTVDRAKSLKNTLLKLKNTLETTELQPFFRHIVNETLEAPAPRASFRGKLDTLKAFQRGDTSADASKIFLR